MVGHLRRAAERDALLLEVLRLEVVEVVPAVAVDLDLADLGGARRLVLAALQHGALDLAPTIAASTTTFGSCRRAASMAASRSSGADTLVMPMLEPARAGLTKTGKPREATASMAAALSRCHWESVITAYGPTGARALEDHLHEVLVHARRGGEHAGADVADVRELEQSLDRAVLAERPVQQREHDVDLAQAVRHLARLLDGEGALRAAERHHHAGVGGLDLRGVPGGQLEVRGSPSMRTQWPSRAMPIGMTS